MSRYDELKPCPFCGGEGCIQRHEFVGYTDTFGVVCLDCGCETRQFFTHKKAAVRAWNGRADRPIPEDMISRCELFNKLAVIPAPPEANEYKAEVYKVINGM